jgi:hypothetical protein
LLLFFVVVVVGVNQTKLAVLEDGRKTEVFLPWL